MKWHISVHKITFHIFILNSPTSLHIIIIIIIISEIYLSK